MTALERYAELARKVDAFTERVARRYPAGLACAPGCDACCRRKLTVTRVEAAAIEGLLARGGGEIALPPRRDDACDALLEDGRCAIYEARPLVCRSHGLPLRFPPEPGDPRRLPLLDACEKNFVARPLGSIDADCVLDQTTLSTVLAAIDAAYAAENGEPQGVRIELGALLDAALRDGDPLRRSSGS